MKTRDQYTGKSYDIAYKGDDTAGALLLANNGDVQVGILPAWCIPLAQEAARDGDVILAEAIIKAAKQ